MKYLNKILDLNWLEPKHKSHVSKTPSKDPRKREEDVTLTKFEDEGGMYLLCLDWDTEDVNQFANNSLFDEWERKMENTGLILISGSIADDGDIEVIETSFPEIFDHEEQESS